MSLPPMIPHMRTANRVLQSFRRRPSRAAAVSFLLILAPAWPGDRSALAADVQRPRPAVSDITAVRSGVALVPLTAERGGANWPAELPVRFANNAPAIRAPVIWIERDDARFVEGWTHDPRNLRARAIRPDDESSGASASTGLGPYAAVRLPADGVGVISIAGQDIRPNWTDLPEWGAHSPFLAMRHAGAESAAMPDPGSPFEYWRSVFTASGSIEITFTPGDAVVDETPEDRAAAAMAAEAYADLWRAGIARLQKLDKQLADQCIELLTARTLAGHTEVATWVMDPQQTNALLGVLLNWKQRDQRLVEGVKAWIAAQQRVLAWVDRVEADHVIVRLVARGTPDVIDATIGWQGASATSAVRIDPRTMLEFRLPRELESTASSAVVVVKYDEFERSLAVGPSTFTVTPPGLYLGPFGGAAMLAAVEQSVVQAPGESRSTSAQIRKVNGRWEVLCECRRPLVASPTGDGELPQVIDSLDSIRGMECIALRVGSGDWAVELVVPETGWPRVLRGEHDGSLQVHRQRYEDRWFARIVLPSSWLRLDQRNDLGLLRGHGDAPDLHGVPGAPTWWDRVDSGGLGLRLDAWK